MPHWFRSVSMALALGIPGAPGFAQAPVGATPHSPDLLGIYPGMTMNEARAQLQKHSSHVSVESNMPHGFGLSIPQEGDTVTVFLTQAPNDPPTVWMVTRSQIRTATSEMTAKGVSAALREKYGKETFLQNRGGGGLYSYWIFDSTGKLLASADPALMGCSGWKFVNNIKLGPDPGNSILDRCYAGFFAITAQMNGGTEGVLQSYSVELVNLPYAVRAAKVTANAANAAAKNAFDDQIRQADQNKPKF